MNAVLNLSLASFVPSHPATHHSQAKNHLSQWKLFDNLQSASGVEFVLKNENSTSKTGAREIITKESKRDRTNNRTRCQQHGNQLKAHVVELVSRKRVKSSNSARIVKVAPEALATWWMRRRMKAISFQINKQQRETFFYPFRTLAVQHNNQKHKQQMIEVFSFVFPTITSCFLVVFGNGNSIGVGRSCWWVAKVELRSVEEMLCEIIGR